MFRLEDLTYLTSAAASAVLAIIRREAGQPAQVSVAIKRLVNDPQYPPVCLVRPAACA